MKKISNNNQRDFFIKDTPMALRVWNSINPPNKPIHYKVISVKEAAGLIMKLQYQQRNNEAVDISIFGLEGKYGINWEEWSDEHGDIHKYIDRNRTILPKERYRKGAFKSHK